MVAMSRGTLLFVFYHVLVCAPQLAFAGITYTPSFYEIDLTIGGNWNELTNYTGIMRFNLSVSQSIDKVSFYNPDGIMKIQSVKLFWPPPRPYIVHIPYTPRDLYVKSTTLKSGDGFTYALPKPAFNQFINANEQHKLEVVFSGIFSSGTKGLCTVMHCIDKKRISYVAAAFGENNAVFSIPFLDKGRARAGLNLTVHFPKELNALSSGTVANLTKP